MKLKLFFYTSFIFFLISFRLQAQEIIDYKVYDHKVLEGQTLKVFSENGLITLFAIKPNVIKVSFSSIKNNEKQIINKENGVYVRVTQNLDDIFMLTDSLLIIINKFDFTIKFEKRNEAIYTVSHYIDQKNNQDALTFSMIPNEVFFNSKKQLKPKHKRKPIYSTKGYGFQFQNNRWIYSKNEGSAKLTFENSVKELEFIFFSGFLKPSPKSLKSFLKY